MWPCNLINLMEIPIAHEAPFYSISLVTCSVRFPYAQLLHQHLEVTGLWTILDLTHGCENRTLNADLLEILYAEKHWTGPTLIGEYHFRGEEGLRILFTRFLGSGNSYSCSGILTLAFLAFSNLAPSSVEPFSPQRTWKYRIRNAKVGKGFRKAIKILPCNLRGNTVHVSQAQTWILLK